MKNTFFNPSMPEKKSLCRCQYKEECQKDEDCGGGGFEDLNEDGVKVRNQPRGKCLEHHSAHIPRFTSVF